MSEVEETIERIRVQGGVEGYVICSKEGQVLRRYPSMTQEAAEKMAASMMRLAEQARGVVRDLSPRNELNYLRVRARRHEVMLAFDLSFLVIIVQRWTPAGEKAQQ